MGVYDNINGSLVPIAPNIRVQNSAIEQYVTEAELVEGLSTKQDVIQYNTLPTASEDNLGKVVQYMGTTNANYTHGYFYECVSDGQSTPTYSWVNVRVEDDIPHYDTMPSDAEILEMPDNTVFETLGFYSKNDNCGGLYLITTSYTQGSLQIKEDGVTKRYLMAYSSDDATTSKIIDVVRYGIRPSQTSSNWTVENTYARQNTTIFNNILKGMTQCIMKFPVGRFFFESGINLSTNQTSIIGATSPQRCVYDDNTYTQGTALFFPFLTNGQTAINVSFGNVENVTIFGNPSTYNIDIDRTKTITAPDEVVTETIAQSSGTDVKCTGLLKSANGVINNVDVMYFYNGINCNATNTRISNIRAYRCHIGVQVGNDVKCNMIHGWGVHTGLVMDGDISSAIGVRIDSCVHALRLANGKGMSVTDLDGDYCTESLIAVGREDESASGVENVIVSQMHGRCCTLKRYDSSQADGVDVRTLSDTSGYGMIRVGVGCSMVSNVFIINNRGIANPMDTSSTYRCPNIILTYASGSAISDYNHFIIGANMTEDNILKSFQISNTRTLKIDTAIGDYYLSGTTLDKETRLSNIKSVVAASSDFADFQTRIAAL